MCGDTWVPRAVAALRAIPHLVVLRPADANETAEAWRVALGWERWVGPWGRILGVHRFGASAPGAVVMEKYGFTVDRVVELAREALAAAAG